METKIFDKIIYHQGQNIDYSDIRLGNITINAFISTLPITDEATCRREFKKEDINRKQIINIT